MATVPPTQAVEPEPELPSAPPVEEPDHEPPEWFDEHDAEGMSEDLLAAGVGAGLSEKIKRKARSQLRIAEPEAYGIYCKPVGVGGTPPWCVYFLAWCWREVTGTSHPHAPWENVTFKGFGHTREVHDWAQQHGKLAQRPLSGMLYGIEDGFEHTGLILGANARTLDLWTINGNWGNRVATQSWKHVGGRRWKYGPHEHTLFFASW
jgi:hypothetical protein